MSKIKKKDLFYVYWDSLVLVEGRNNRVDYGDLQELANSILMNGVKEPLRVERRKGTDIYEVTNGHRRYLALEILWEQGHKIEIPILRERNNTEWDILLTQIVSNDGKKFNMYEQSKVYGKMRSLGKSPKEIAEATGKSITHISDCLLIEDAPEALKVKIQEGKVTATLVVQQLKRSTAEEVNQELDAAIKESGGAKVTKKDLHKLPSDIKLTCQDLIDVQEDLEGISETEDIELDGEKLNIINQLSQFFQKKQDIKSLFTYFLKED